MKQPADDDPPYGIVFLVGLLVGMLLGACAISATAATHFHKEAIQKGVGEYDSETGEFRLKWHWERKR